MNDMFHFNSPVNAQVDRRRRSGHDRMPKNSGRRRPSRTDRLRSDTKTAPLEGVAVSRDDGPTTTDAGSILNAPTAFNNLPQPMIGVAGEQRWGSIVNEPSVPFVYPATDTTTSEGRVNPTTTSYPEEFHRPATLRGVLLTNQSLHDSTGQVRDDRDGRPNPLAALSGHDRHALVTEAAPLLGGASSTISTVLFDSDTLDAPPSQFRPNTPEAIPPDPVFINSSQAQFVIDSSFNEDAWPVDDRRRTYDYCDFVTTWWERSADHRIAMLSDSRSRQLLQHCRVLDEVISPSSLESNTDMQGLRWNGTYPSREEALHARICLHPRRKSRNYLGHPTQTRYTFRNFVSAHRAMFSHYQLRSVLAASGRHDIFYAARGRVWRTSLSCPTLAEAVLDHSKLPERTEGFQITCLSASPADHLRHNTADKVLIAGGFNGEFILVNTDSSSNHIPVEGHVTRAHNGLVTHIHQFENRQSGLPKVSFCSNEGKMRLMDIRTVRFTNTFSYDNIPINCSVTSPDRRLRALVGDMKDIFITDSEEGKILVTLQKHHDHGFACAWSADGRYVATAAQDDMVLVWDARKWHEPVVVHSTVMSCARSLHFTESGALVVAENEDIVSIYEAGVFKAKQDLQFFGSIAGVALINGGEEIVVANCDASVGGLLTFESQSARTSCSFHR